MSNKKTILDPVDQLYMEHLRKAQEENIHTNESSQKKLYIDKQIEKKENTASPRRAGAGKIRLADIGLKPQTYRIRPGLIEKIDRCRFWKQKKIVEIVNEALEKYFWELEKECLLPIIPEDKDILKHFEELNPRRNTPLKTVEEPAIK